MTFQETMTAANNLDRIEAVLGHPIPGGTIDMKDISRHTLSFSEIQRIAVDIQRIEAIREADKNRSFKTEMIIFAVILLICWIVSWFE